eukprot:scaffold1210_cov410-Prasinococcus_capsulatus_cf.AAC.10
MCLTKPRLPCNIVNEQAGLVLVGSCPGGTISNVVSHVAKADVPLSVIMTSVSTLVACVLTPWLTWMLCGAIVHVDPIALMTSVGTTPLHLAACVWNVSNRTRRLHFQPNDTVLQLMPALAVVVSTFTTSTAVAGCSHLLQHLPDGGGIALCAECRVHERDRHVNWHSLLLDANPAANHDNALTWF